MKHQCNVVVFNVRIIIEKIEDVHIKVIRNSVTDTMLNDNMSLGPKENIYMEMKMLLLVTTIKRKCDFVALHLHLRL